MTLRARLTLALVCLVAGGLLIADGATYVSLRAFLYDGIDRDLQDARVPMTMALLETTTGPGRAGLTTSLPPGTYGQVRDASGTVLNAVTFTYSGTQSVVPDLPSPLPSPGAHGQPTFTVPAMGDRSTSFRVLVQELSQSGQTLVVAVPLSDVQQTLHRLLLAELIVTLGALGGLALIAWLLVKRELRPLEDMGATAAQIAGGDLSQRVERAEPRTEVGRLGLSLNAMLEQIERAFAERTASEEKLRRFVADASHELRTPLTSIRGYAEVFRRGARNDPEGLETSMRRIENESRRMGVLVEELLQLARLGEGREPEREPVDLARVAADSVVDAHAVAPDRDVSLESPGELIVIGDDVQLRQVVANLISNALRHTSPASPVRVRLSAQGSMAVLDVADEGPGLPDEEAAKVFEPFYRTDASRARETGGTGLGLAIVAAIVKAHSGEVALVTAPGRGATFTVRLPLAAPVA